MTSRCQDRILRHTAVSAGPSSRSGSWNPFATKRAHTSVRPPSILHVSAQRKSTPAFEGTPSREGSTTLNLPQEAIPRPYLALNKAVCPLISERGGPFTQRLVATISCPGGDTRIRDLQGRERRSAPNLFSWRIPLMGTPFRPPPSPVAKAR